ncbi:hypothetical protein HYZ97_04470 [Candidatus Pacearchaeota archaeon]|nr:hypothetical protein [Candidatus Pacearchaeota archaeon]
MFTAFKQRVHTELDAMKRWRAGYFTIEASFRKNLELHYTENILRYSSWLETELKNMRREEAPIQEAWQSDIYSERSGIYGDSKYLDLVFNDHAGSYEAVMRIRSAYEQTVPQNILENYDRLFREFEQEVSRFDPFYNSDLIPPASD